MRKLIALVILINTTFITNAQKLPTIQQVSVWAPPAIKIDGKATEWGDKFQAYNKMTDVFYTIANDDDNLYLTLQAADPDIITKIVNGGVTITIISQGKKESKNGITITFPTYDKNNKSLYLTMSNRPQLTKDTLRTRIQTDSFMNVLNGQLAEHLKIIEITGVKTIPDNIIYIYNQEGVKAASRFDNKIRYTCEFALPLKYLNLTNYNPVKFNYNIKLNGTIPKGSTMVNTGRPEIISFIGPDGKSYSAGHATPQNLILAYPTDFWGEYTLAKK